MIERLKASVTTAKSISVLMVSTEYPPMFGGIGRYTKNLSDALKKLGVGVYIACNERGNGDYFSLDAFNSHNSDVLMNIVDELSPDLVHIQLEHGLYGLKLGTIGPNRTSTNIDQFYEKCQVPIITTFHSAYPFTQWMRLARRFSMHPTYIDRKNLFHILPINIAKQILEYWKRVLNYKSFSELNKRKMQKSKASIVFSDYLARLLLDNISNSKYNNDLQNKCKIIYHGAEPKLRYAVTKEEARSVFSLPTDKSIKIALATGFATNTKGWDILKEMHIPENWIIVTNHSRNHYSKEIPVLSHPSSYKITVNDINSSKSNHDTRLLEINRGFLTDEELSILFYASDAVILPYTVTSGSGVMFDALAHGLPFIASDLGFFREFANKGLGIVVNRKSEEFSNAIKVLDKNYLQYVERVNHFSKTHLRWDSVAKQHVELYLDVISNADYGRNYSNNYMPTQKQNDIENSLLASANKYSLLLPLNYLKNKFINLS
jgi:glycosyltransferase involved in cell wall biosynthesis